MVKLNSEHIVEKRKNTENNIPKKTICPKKTISKIKTTTQNVYKSATIVCR